MFLAEENDNDEQDEQEDDEKEPEPNPNPLPEEEGEGEEPEMDDPQIRSLEKRMSELEETPNLDKLRALHRELVAKHETNRETLRQSYGKVL